MAFAGSIPLLNEEKIYPEASPPAVKNVRTEHDSTVVCKNSSTYHGEHHIPTCPQRKGSHYAYIFLAESLQ
jgi:hypothetical protein